MEIKYRKELGNEREVEKKARWHSKFMDSVTEIAVSIGNSLKKTACLIAVPTIIAVGATGCYSSYQRYGEEMPVDSSTDTAVDTSDEDVPAELPPSPCGSLSEESAVMKNLIGDYINRKLYDRKENVSGDIYSEYPLDGFEHTFGTNPFLDGEGGTIGPAETFMHWIYTTDTVDLASPVILDFEIEEGEHTVYFQRQELWIRGSNYYSDSHYDVVGDMGFIAYSSKFSDFVSDSPFGIPVCGTGVDGDYTACKNVGGDISRAIETHRLEITFLGETWLITEMEAPEADGSLHNEDKVYNGGYIKLGKEFASGDIYIGETLVGEGFGARLVNIEMDGDRAMAVISIVDESGGEVLATQNVYVGQTGLFEIDGNTHRVRIWDISLESLAMAKISILSDEVTIKDGERLDPDSDRFAGWHGFVGWKDRDAGEGTRPDILRIFGIYSDDLADISSSGESTLLPGEGFSFPYGFGVCYSGLDTTEENLHRLSFRVNSEDNYEIPWTRGPWDPVTGDWAACTLYPPFVKVDIVSDDIYFEKISGESAVSDKFYVAIGGAHCEGSIGDLEAGTYFIQETPYPTSHYTFEEYEGIASLMGFTLEPVHDVHQANIGWFRWEDDRTPHDPERPVDNLPTFIFRITEYAGGGSGNVDATYFATDGSSFNLDVNYTDTGEPVFRRDHLVYQYAGPVNSRDTLGFIEEGYITERGSVFSSITDAVSPVVDSQVEYYLSDQVAYSVFYIGKKE